MKKKVGLGMLTGHQWCVCGKCRPMQTFTESLCCRDTNEVPDDLFEGL